jgi:hypothetical protein
MTLRACSLLNIKQRQCRYIGRIVHGLIRFLSDSFCEPEACAYRLFQPTTLRPLQTCGVLPGLRDRYSGVAQYRRIHPMGWLQQNLSGGRLHHYRGQSRDLVLEGNMTQGTIAADGSASVSGTATLDLGDGTPVLPVSWLNVVVNTNGLVLSVDSATLPVALTSGSVAID